MKQLSKAGGIGATLRDLYKAMKDRTPDQIEETLRQLTKAGMVEEVEADSPKGGRPTIKFRLG